MSKYLTTHVRKSMTDNDIIKLVVFNSQTSLEQKTLLGTSRAVSLGKIKEVLRPHNKGGNMCHQGGGGGSDGESGQDSTETGSNKPFTFSPNPMLRSSHNTTHVLVSTFASLPSQ